MLTFKQFIDPSIITMEESTVSLYHEYRFLQLLRDLVGQMIRFDDFDDITFRVLEKQKSIIVVNNKIGLNKIIKLADIKSTMNFSPAMFIEFLQVNGAQQTGPSMAGVTPPVATAERRRNLLGHRDGGLNTQHKDKTGWIRDEQGFWHKEEQTPVRA